MYSLSNTFTQFILQENIKQKMTKMLAFALKNMYNKCMFKLWRRNMSANLVNAKDLDNYIKDVVYRGQEQEIFDNGNFNSVEFVEQNKDAIVRSMLYQWTRYTLKPYLSTKTPKTMRFLPLINVTDGDLPTWAQQCMNKGEPVYRFKADKISDSMKENITTVRDFLYAVGESYVNKILARAKDTAKKYADNPKAKGNKDQEKPKIRIDYLKTNTEYADFENVLKLALKWHENIATNTKFKKYDVELYKESLAGTEPVMDLRDGMHIVQLTTPEALDFESEYMGHCVGKGYYDNEIKRGSVKIYSLRDENGEPHATFEVHGNKIEQCKGKQDKAPVAKYRPYVQEFVRAQKFDIDGDAKNIGLIKCGKEYYDVFNLPKGKKLVLNGDLDISDMGLTELPDLSNLIVKGYFNCRKNKLKNLQGAPAQVLNEFYCEKNELSTLKGLSAGIRSLHCSLNQLTSLKYMPDVIEDLYCDSNQLNNFIGGPKKVNGMLRADFNPLTSFAGFPDSVKGEFRAVNNDLEHIDDIAGCVKGSVFIYIPKTKALIVKQKGKLLDLTKQPEGFVYKGYIDLSKCGLEKLPDLSHVIVTDCFYCENNRLTSFAGSPKEVGEVFIGNNNPVTSLEGLPEIIREQLDLIDLPKLKTLKGISKEIGKFLSLYGCPKLEDLDFLPQKGCEAMCIDERFIKKYHLEKGASLQELQSAVAKYNAAIAQTAREKE